MTILSAIIEKRLEDLKSYDVSTFNFSPIDIQRPRLYDVLQQAKQLQIIAEIKRASPSKGAISLNVNPIEQAFQYEQSGASCISVLTEPHFFKGSYEDLHAVAKNVCIPVLCKDFIIDPIQIDIAKAAGASVILLIVAAMDEQELKRLFDYAISKNLEVLMEVHTVEELKIAKAIGANIIGINNRNLKTFEVDLQTTATIAKHIQDDQTVIISESGVRTNEDALYLADQHAKGLLIGETLMRTADITQTLQQFKVPVKVGV